MRRTGAPLQRRGMAARLFLRHIRPVQGLTAQATAHMSWLPRVLSPGSALNKRALRICFGRLFHTRSCCVCRKAKKCHGEGRRNTARASTTGGGASRERVASFRVELRAMRQCVTGHAGRKERRSRPSCHWFCAIRLGRSGRRGEARRPGVEEWRLIRRPPS